MEDAKSPGSVYVCYDCAMLLLRVRFSSLEIKNVHSHKLEMTLVLPFLFQKVGFTSPMKYAVDRVKQYYTVVYRSNESHILSHFIINVTKANNHH